jgi:hypothetical protein
MKATNAPKCPICGQGGTDPCRNTIDPAQPLPGRLNHHAREEATQ